MLVLIIVPQRFTFSHSQNSKPRPAIRFDQSMLNQHLCPCCSYVLLRHIRHGNVCWRCSHCHEVMPAWLELGGHNVDHSKFG